MAKRSSKIEPLDIDEMFNSPSLDGMLSFRDVEPAAAAEKLRAKTTLDTTGSTTPFPEQYEAEPPPSPIGIEIIDLTPIALTPIAKSTNEDHRAEHLAAPQREKVLFLHSFRHLFQLGTHTMRNRQKLTSSPNFKKHLDLNRFAESSFGHLRWRMATQITRIVSIGTCGEQVGRSRTVDHDFCKPDMRSFRKRSGSTERMFKTCSASWNLSSPSELSHRER